MWLAHPTWIGLESLRFYLDLCEDINSPPAVLVYMARLILTKNYFLYDNDCYLQTQGIAMCSSFTLDLAIEFKQGGKVSVFQQPLPQ